MTVAQLRDQFSNLPADAEVRVDHSDACDSDLLSVGMLRADDGTQLAVLTAN